MQQPRSPALVLVADDDATNLELICSTLASDRIDTAVAHDGEEVLEVVGIERPDVILLDALMPGIDGFETCKRLKAEPATKGIPVIFMTSLTESRYRVAGFSAGAVDYVTKPVEAEELLARVRTQIALRSAMRELEATARALERRSEELREANARLSEELRERERAEAARAALQAEIIAAQRARLSELAAPLIPITDGTLVMPLVGTVDAERAQHAVEAALRGAVAHRAEHLIIDLTGLGAVDATVAGMLLQAARGLGLLGVRAIITGVRPEVAQTLVQLDLDFDRLVLLGTLQAGVELALRRRRGVAGERARRRARRSR